MATSKAVGRLWVGLDMQTNGFQAGMKKVVGEAREGATKIKGVFGSVFAGSFLGNLAAGAFSKVLGAIRGQFGKVFEQFGKLDEIAKLARELGMSSEALIAWRQHAELSGVSVETFTKGLQKLQVELGKATMGATPAAAALKQLGLDAKVLAAGPLDKAFEDIADAIDKETDATKRAALLAQIFGDEGVRIARMMEGGAMSLDQAIKEARKQGMLFSRSELAMIEAANDAITKLKSTIEAIYQRIAVALAPYIEQLANKLQSAFASAATSSGSITGAVDDIMIGLELIMGGFKVIAGVLTTAGAAIASVVVTMVEAINKLAGLMGMPLIDQDTIDAMNTAVNQAMKQTMGWVSQGAQQIANVLSGQYYADILAARQKRQAEQNAQAAAGKGALGGAATPAAALIKGTDAAYTAVAEHYMRGAAANIQEQQLAAQQQIAAAQEAAAEEAKQYHDDWMEWYKTYKQNEARRQAPRVATIGV